MPDAYIVAAKRTAGGRRKGALSGWHPADLCAQVVDHMVEATGADPAAIDDVIVGCVGQAGEQSFNIGRNVVLASSLPETVPGTSVDRQCGSSQQAMHFAAQAVMSGTQDMVIAAGVESMTRVPMGLAYTLPKKNGLGTYISPNIQTRYPGIEFSQFDGAETIARKYGFSRERLDAFAQQSHERAANAAERGQFDDEILPVASKTPDGDTGEMHTRDEGVRAGSTVEALAELDPIVEGGLLTAGNASQMCDGASAVMVVNETGLEALGVEPIARIHHMSVYGGDPVVMLETPIEATRRALSKAGMTLDDIDLFEVNEAFAPIPLAFIEALGADPSKVNVRGGAIALGHPLGATGTKLMTTLVHALQKRGARYGLQTMCEGGGLANVTLVERL
ncbi:acetyl-CoA C-acetyltransferase [Roseivivax marinus]|uniref:acetyl-CoA C-acetyltransferase n=1 Tax=Roseivivax marinus TaxID=1379903 RepID=UPI001F034086|nr:acetyl-CoA C-acetyltransferase [Roseivivax marinus]UMA66213.1 acetyl-CoA C-acetyltransferase [Roseivivax marinus]